MKTQTKYLVSLIDRIGNKKQLLVCGWSKEEAKTFVKIFYYKARNIEIVEA